MAVQAQQPAGADYVIHNFKFESGETLPELKIHYIALGKPRKDANGIVDRERTRTLESRAERLPFHERHRVPGEAVDFSRREQGHEMRVVEAGRHRDLALEAFEGPR